MQDERKDGISVNEDDRLTGEKARAETEELSIPAGDADSADEKREKRLLKRSRIMTVVLSILLVAVIAGSVPTFAWFYMTKQIAAYIPISAPESLYIGTGHGEDIKYLYLSGIDVTDEKGYIDYVISIKGEGSGQYKIQLGYTTNNQFGYELYVADKMNKSGYDAYVAGLGEGDPDDAIEYGPHDGDPTEYYVKTGAAISGTFLNKRVDSEILADPTADEHNLTYSGYNNVQKYAEALYWQTSSSLGDDDRVEFTDYYILRVTWTAGRDNKRETDVLCIAARLA